MVFVLISVALPELCAEFECFSQDLTDMLLILQRILLLCSLYLSALCITVSRDREQLMAPARADKRSVARSPNEYCGFVLLSVRFSNVAPVN